MDAELTIVEKFLDGTDGGFTEEEMEEMFKESANEQPSLFQRINDKAHPYVMETCSIM